MLRITEKSDERNNIILALFLLLVCYLPIFFLSLPPNKRQSNMAKKKIQKAKEPIKLRYKKLANGNTSLYLDCYKNGQRSYEFLRLYLVPENSMADTIANKNTLQAAMAIKTERLQEIINGEAGLASSSKGKILLTDWVLEVGKRKAKAGRKTMTHYEATNIYIKETKGGDRIMLKDTNRDFCLRFIETLATSNSHLMVRGKLKEQSKKLKQNTQELYSTTLSAALNEAVRDGIIKKNPMTEISPEDKPRRIDSDREFLNQDELRKLAATPCKIEDLKRAFIFGCFCGLRISDIRALTWKKIVKVNGKDFLYLRMEKTLKNLMLPLSNAAKEWLPERKGAANDDRIFAGIPQNSGTIKYYLDKWIQAAGVTKHVTFHVSRHTFATLELTLGADLYTVSKLLGHTRVGTTQIYAKVIDKKKEEAVNLMDSILDSGTPGSSTNDNKNQTPGKETDK